MNSEKSDKDAMLTINIVLRRNGVMSLHFEAEQEIADGVVGTLGLGLLDRAAQQIRQHHKDTEEPS